jgi:hypothetical protein|tara:strand:+ start:167 stop:421 length:255 start_codon:yes stop_codon:yes gene_type:complete
MTQLFPGEDEKYTDENGAEYKVDRDSHDHDLTYENEQSTVTIPLREYDRLKEQKNYITDPTLIGAIDKMEFFLKELRKHIVRKY